MNIKKPTEHDFLLADLRAVLKTKAGRKVLWHLLGVSGLYVDSIYKYDAGRRSIGLMLLQLIEEADSTAYPHMILEFNTKGLK